jgi:hypothetical protein
VQQLPTHLEPEAWFSDDEDGHYEPAKTGVYGSTFHASGEPSDEG